jgi:RNA polymerase sigma-70 factor (ECF subfamily)
MVNAKIKKDRNEFIREANAEAGLSTALPSEGRSLPDGDTAWNECWRRVRGIVAGLVRDRTEINADDVTQDVMLKVWGRRSQFQGNSDFKTWLYRISVNAALDARRGIRDDISSLQEVRSGGRAEDGETRIPEPAGASNLVEIIYAHELLDRLTPENKKIFELKMQGLAPDLIGKQLGISAELVRKRMNRISRQLCKEQKGTDRPSMRRRPSGSKIRRTASSQE